MSLLWGGGGQDGTRAAPAPRLPWRWAQRPPPELWGLLPLVFLQQQEQAVLGPGQAGGRELHPEQPR